MRGRAASMVSGIQSLLTHGINADASVRLRTNRSSCKRADGTLAYRNLGQCGAFLPFWTRVSPAARQACSAKPAYRRVVNGPTRSPSGAGTTAELEEERRLLYVAMTR